MRVGLVFLFLVACGGVIGESDGGADVKADVPIKVDAGDCKCSSSQWCKHDATCGSTSGTCMTRPTGCDDILDLVCGEDTKVYPNECDANMNGVDLRPNGGCIPPAGYISCGAHFCNAASEYCQSTGNDAIGPGQPCTYYACQPLPTSCKGSQDCDCFGTSGTPCSQGCTFDGAGFQLVCPGG